MKRGLLLAATGERGHGTAFLTMPSKDKHFHFTGICGTAMGAVAAAMKERGVTNFYGHPLLVAIEMEDSNYE